MFDVTAVIGFLGASLVLLAFILNQRNVWKNDYIWYDTVNLTGALFLVAYSYLLGSYPFLILNMVWAGVSLKDIVIYRPK